jgi:hypothetical protein
MVVASLACSKKDDEKKKSSGSAERGAITQNLVEITTAILPAFESGTASLLEDKSPHQLLVEQLRAVTSEGPARAAVFDLLHADGTGAANIFDNFRNVSSSLMTMTKSCTTKVGDVVVSPFPFANLGNVEYACKRNGSLTAEEMYDAAVESEPAKVQEVMGSELESEKRSVAWRIDGKTTNFLFSMEDSGEEPNKVTRKVGQGYFAETDALVNFVTHIDYKEGHSNHAGGAYTPRTEIKGNPATGKFTLRQYESSSKAIFGAGLSKGAGNKFLIKTVVDGSEKFFCLDANPTFAAILAADVYAEADVPEACAAYLAEIEALVPFTAADAPTDAIYKEL